VNRLFPCGEDAVETFRFRYGQKTLEFLFVDIDTREIGYSKSSDQFFAIAVPEDVMILYDT
jgi:hypothetical protein